MENKRIALSLPHLGGQEKKYVNDAIDSGWVVPLGPHVDALEVDIQRFLGGTHYISALSSGTAALHLGLILMGVGQDDEVICQSMTFSASANPIVYQGATPVFVDSERDTWNMCPEHLEVAIIDRRKKGKKVKAIIPVHLYGMPAKMDEIILISEKYQIPILEDAAEALGSAYKGKRCGTMGEMACLSFNGNKIITTSGGGALVTNTESAAKKAKFLATQARDNAPHYQHSHIGYNYRMSNIVAGFGRGQMEVLNLRVEQRRNNFDVYKMGFEKETGVQFQEGLEGMYSNRWLTSILVYPDKCNGVTREDIRISLNELNIETRPLWKPMHLQPIFNDAPYYGSDVSAHLFDHGLCIPSSSSLTDEDRQRVIEAIREVIAKGK